MDLRKRMKSTWAAMDPLDNEEDNYMAAKKKSTVKAPIDETAPVVREQNTAPDESKQTAETEQESPAESEQTAEMVQTTESPEIVTEGTPCPFEATVAVALAILRKGIEPATAEMLKPVATLKQGTKITITDIHGSNARLANGLWIALEYITR